METCRRVEMDIRGGMLCIKGESVLIKKLRTIQGQGADKNSW